MTTALTIQEVAELTGLSAHTLRYYERIGLVDPVPRTETGYRSYTEAQISQMRALKYLRGVGMTIRQIREFGGFYRRGDYAECYALLQAHQSRLTEQLAIAQEYLAALEVKLAVFRARAEQPEHAEAVGS